MRKAERSHPQVRKFDLKEDDGFSKKPKRKSFWSQLSHFFVMNGERFPRRRGRSR